MLTSKKAKVGLTEGGTDVFGYFFSPAAPAEVEYSELPFF